MRRIKHNTYRTLGSLSVFFALCTGAVAQDRDVCIARDGARSIEACSRIITARQLAGKDLATIYVLRASMYRSNQQYSLAIDDLTKAIDLLKASEASSVVASAFNTRASIYALAGDTAKALDDYRQALALDSSNAQAAQGVQELQAQVAAKEAPGLSASAEQASVPAPNEPLPPDIVVPPDVLQLVQTNPFFANAPTVRLGNYSYTHLSSSHVNGVNGTTENTYDSSVKWIKQGLASERSIMDLQSSYGNTRTRSETQSLGAADGLVGLGFISVSTSYIPNMKTIHSTFKSLLQYIRNLQGTVFPMRIGNRFSYEMGYKTASIPYGVTDEMTETDQCEISQRFDASHFHPDLSGSAYLESCATQVSYKKNKAANAITQSRTLFFEQLGYPIRVDPQSPPEKIIQTYFKDETTETARLQSFFIAR